MALHARASSLVIECPPGAVPLWRYWGPRLRDDFASGPALAATRPTPSFSLDTPVGFSVFPSFGLGWFAQSALLAHREGADFAQNYDRVAIAHTPGAPLIEISLGDSRARIAVRLRIELDHDSDMLSLSTRLTNEGEAPLALGWLAAAALPLPDLAVQVESFSGRHNAEFAPQIDRLGRAQWRKENRRGLTSHDAFPGALVTLADTSEAHGGAYGAQLGWSGNHLQSIDWLDDGRYQWQLGEWLAPGEISLAPGESYASPEVLASFSPHGRNGVAHNFHAAIRARIDWPDAPMAPRPVHLNTWEGYYFDHDLPALMRLADVAAEVGIERFVLDDGWFHRRDDDRRGLGDWWCDTRKYPEGLAPLADHVVARGMAFGLWVEPEMVNPDSDLFRAHPDWALQLAGHDHRTARNQLVLDLTRSDVSDYLFDNIAKLLRDLPISYLKWDHNRNLVAAGGRDGRAVYHAQIVAAYALFARFRAAFPQLEIEACAGGGGRIDAGIIRHTHRFWTSDCIDAVSRVAMQRGFLRFMPPEVMGAHVGTAPAHSTGRSQSLDFRAAVALQGHFGVEFDLVKLGAGDRTRLAAWIEFYKRWRATLHQQVWTGSAGDHLVWHGAGNDDLVLLIVYRMAPMQHSHMPPVRLPFVAHDARYAVCSTGPDGDGPSVIYDGSWLAQAGLSVAPGMAETAQLFTLRRV